MTFVAKGSRNSWTSFIRLSPGPFVIILMGAVVATTHLILGRNPLCALHRGTFRFPGIPSGHTCQDGYAAVDADGHACISLKDFTARTFIHRARTPETTYMYCSIPKNGCSYHIDMLHRVNGDLYAGKRKHMTENKGKIIIDDEEEAAELLNNRSIPKYMVIRNPMTRVLSGYLCKVERYIPEIEKTPATFQRWVREQFTDLKSWGGVNPHWRAQTTFCGYDMRDIQKRFHVFRVEKPAEYVDFLYKIIPSRVLETGWGENKEDYRSFVLSPHKRTGHTEEKFYDYVGNLETFDLLERIYRRDIDVLGYRDQVTQMRTELARIIGHVAKKDFVAVKN